jgi:hypothetical protein
MTSKDTLCVSSNTHCPIRVVEYKIVQMFAGEAHGKGPSMV